jgi:hypothetical protein
MKPIVSVLLLAALIGVTTLWAQNSESDQKIIKQLEARLQALEIRVTSLEKTKQTKHVTIPSSQLPGAAKPPGRPFEFNGQTYYLVPLKSGETQKN